MINFQQRKVSTVNELYKIIRWNGMLSATYGLGHISPDRQISHYGGGKAGGGQGDGRPGWGQPRPRPRPCGHGHRVGRLVGGGGVGLLDWWQLAVVAASINSLGVGGALEILLKHRLLSFPVLTHTRGHLLTLLTQFLRPSGMRLMMARLTSLAAISLSSMEAASL